MMLEKNWKFPLCFFFNKISLEIKSHDHFVTKQALLDYKKMDFTQLPYWDFSKGLTHDFGQK